MSNPTIAIAGAGIMGLSAAYALARAGRTVMLYDSGGFPAENASAMAGGMLAPYGEIEHMPPKWVQIGLEGIDFWEKLARTSKNPFDFARNGSLVLAHAEDSHMLERFGTHLKHNLQDKAWNKLSGTAIAELEPALGERFAVGLFLKDEAHLNPREALAALSAACRSEGVQFKPQTLHYGEAQNTYAHIIDCRGMGAQEDQTDLRGVKGEIIIVHNPEFKLARPVRLMHPRYPLYIVPRADHVFMIGATNIESAGNAQVSVRSAMELLSAAYSLHPSFGEAQILDVRAGIRPSYPDNLPRIRVKGKIISCNGLYRHGFLLAPIMAQAAADMIDGRANRHISLFKGEKL